MNKRFGLIAAGGLAVALVAVGGTALATTTRPVNGNVITGCYTNADVNGSHALVLQDASTSCPKGTSAVTWNEQGPAGPASPAGATGATGAAGAQGPAGPTGATGSQGPAGPQGNPGPQGPPGQNGQPGAPGTSATVTPLLTGDPNCPNGGAEIQDGNNPPDTAYVCTGAAGPQGPQCDTGATGPQGPAGPSTAGPDGLDTVIISATGPADNPGFATAVCPADHPYLLGGGGYAVNQNLNAQPLWLDGPTVDGTLIGEGAEINESKLSPLSWTVATNSASSTASAYAICGE